MNQLFRNARGFRRCLGRAFPIGLFARDSRPRNELVLIVELSRFQDDLVLVHVLVSRGEASIQVVQDTAGITIELRHAAGDDNPISRSRLRVVVVHRGKQFIDSLVIAALRDHRELVTSNAENGAVLEDVADNLARTAQVLVTRLMASRVVDQLQVIHV